MWYDVIGVIYRQIIIFLIKKNNNQWCHPEIDTPGFHCPLLLWDDIPPPRMMGANPDINNE